MIETPDADTIKGIIILILLIIALIIFKILEKNPPLTRTIPLLKKDMDGEQNV